MICVYLLFAILLHGNEFTNFFVVSVFCFGIWILFLIPILGMKILIHFKNMYMNVCSSTIPSHSSCKPYTYVKMQPDFGIRSTTTIIIIIIIMITIAFSVRYRIFSVSSTNNQITNDRTRKKMSLTYQM